MTEAKWDLQPHFCLTGFAFSSTIGLASCTWKDVKLLSTLFLRFYCKSFVWANLQESFC